MILYRLMHRFFIVLFLIFFAVINTHACLRNVISQRTLERLENSTATLWQRVGQKIRNEESLSRFETLIYARAYKFETDAVIDEIKQTLPHGYFTMDRALIIDLLNKDPELSIATARDLILGKRPPAARLNTLEGQARSAYDPAATWMVDLVSDPEKLASEDILVNGTPLQESTILKLNEFSDPAQVFKTISDTGLSHVFNPEEQALLQGFSAESQFHNMPQRLLDMNEGEAGIIVARSPTIQIIDATGTTREVINPERAGIRMMNYHVLYVEKVSDEFLISVDTINNTVQVIELDSNADAAANKLVIQRLLSDSLNEGRNRIVESLLSRLTSANTHQEVQLIQDQIKYLTGAYLYGPGESFEIQYEYATLFQRMNKPPPYTP